MAHLSTPKKSGNKRQNRPAALEAITGGDDPRGMVPVRQAGCDGALTFLDQAGGHRGGWLELCGIISACNQCMEHIAQDVLPDIIDRAMRILLGGPVSDFLYRADWRVEFIHDVS
jgi:hypothetical protein